MATGVHQGCPFSMGIFSIIVGKLVDDVAEQFPKAVVTAYADDIIVVCDVDEALNIYAWTQNRFQQL
eukprot:6381664-Prorocentrum_lima.AAC.1